MSNQFSPTPNADTDTISLKDSVARPQVNGETFAKFKGRVLAIGKADGCVVADAADIDELSKLMTQDHADVQYRILTCP